MAATLETAQTIQDYADDGYKYGFVTDIETESAPTMIKSPLPVL